MRRVLPVSLFVLVSLQTACERDEATAPRVPFFPQLVAASSPRIAFQSTRDGPSNIYVMGADGSAPTQLTFTAFGRGDFSPSWSPDGTQIAFVSSRDRLFQPEIYVMGADGSAPTRLTNNFAADGQPTWSPDGRSIAFATDRDLSFGDPDFEIYVMGADGSAPTRLTNTRGLDTDPSWSPDGRQIAFSSFRDGNSEIYVMNADGSAPTRLTDNAASDRVPAGRPTGESWRL